MPKRGDSGGLVKAYIWVRLEEDVKKYMVGNRRKVGKFMKFKKLITVLMIAIIAAAALTVTAQATVINKYNNIYGAHSTVNDLYWEVDGTMTRAETVSRNRVNSTRYIEADMDVYNYSNDNYITGNDDYATGKKQEVSASVARNAKDRTKYYAHLSVMKPSASNTFVIGSNYYRVNQR